jgi:parvulin-like peptidyl-prolyl isomerase
MHKEIKKKINKIRFKLPGNIHSLIAVFGLVVLVVAFLVVLIWQIYYLQNRSQIIEKIAEIIPFPAAKVNNNFISYSDYLKSLRAADNFYQRQNSQDLPEAELKKFALERLIFNELVKSVAQIYKTEVSTQEIDNEMANIIQQKGSREEVESFLRDYYGISLVDYKKQFVEPRLYFIKASEAVADDEGLNGEAKKQIQQVLSRLRNGEKFEDLSKELEGSFINRDFYRGELPTDVEDDLFNLEPNSYTDIITLSDSYQIIRLEKLDKEKGVLTLSALVVPIKTVSQLAEEKRKSEQIKIYLSGVE